MEYFTSHRRQQTLATTAWPKLIQQINNKIIYNIIATGQQKHFHLRHEVKFFFCFFSFLGEARGSLILVAWFFAVRAIAVFIYALWVFNMHHLTFYHCFSSALPHKHIYASER